MDQELTFQPNNTSRNASRSHFGSKKTSMCNYFEPTQSKIMKIKNISETLNEKDLEIQQLKQKLDTYKNICKQKNRNLSIKERKTRKDSNLYAKRTSKSPKIIQPDSNFSFKPSINSKSKKLLRDSDICSKLYQDAKDREVRKRSRVNSEISNHRKRANSSHRSQEKSATKFLIKNILK